MFPGSHGYDLVGRLHRPPGPTEGVALFAHCFTCGKDLHAARRIAEALALRGFATLRFDFTGLGESAGEFADTTFSSNLDDLVSASAWLDEHVGPTTLLVGHSLGGAAVYCAASMIPTCKAVASIGAPSDPGHVANLLADDAETIHADGEAVVQLAGRPFRVKRAFLVDLEEQRMAVHLQELRRAILILHSPQDDTVSVDHAGRLFGFARHPKSFVSLDGADHLLSDQADAAYAGEVIASWARRYAIRATAPRKAEHHDDVEVYTGAELASDIIAHGLHRLRADEPVAVGGTDTGPTPFELVSAGLGACTGMTLRLYADRKEWPLEAVHVHIKHAKVKTDAGRIDRFDREVELTGPLDADQRARLLEIANRCPVHRTLHGEIEVVTTEVAPRRDG